MVRVGLFVVFRGEWQGGANYFRNLLTAYHRYPDAGIKLVVFTPDLVDVRKFESDFIEVNHCEHLNIAPRSAYARRLARRILEYDPLLLRVAKQHKIDLLVHHDVGMQREIQTLYWVPDFQHKRFPEFFSAKECVARDRGIARVSEWGHILLSSQAAVDDFRQHFPELSQVSAHVLHFSSLTSVDAPLLTKRELEPFYPVREPFFFLPNQFWKHKNHEVVVDALKRTSPNIRVICSGLMEDRRDPQYVPSLLEKVSRAGLEQRFVCLGSVGYQEVISLMHHSVAVIQPSLFEGWSTSVEEAKALCKKIILSNLPVHLEQAPDRGIFFSPYSPEELAKCLSQAYEEFNPKAEEKFAAERFERSEKVGREWMESFARIVRRVIG